MEDGDVPNQLQRQKSFSHFISVIMMWSLDKQLTHQAQQGTIVIYIAQ